MGESFSGTHTPTRVGRCLCIMLQSCCVSPSSGKTVELQFHLTPAWEQVTELSQYIWLSFWKKVEIVTRLKLHLEMFAFDADNIIFQQF